MITITYTGHAVGGACRNVVVADESETRKIVVTTYRPDLHPDRWDATFRHRRRAR